MITTPTTLAMSPQWDNWVPYHHQNPKPALAWLIWWAMPSQSTGMGHQRIAPHLFTHHHKTSSVTCSPCRAPTIYTGGLWWALAWFMAGPWARPPGKNALAQAIAVGAPGLGSKTPGTGTVGSVQTWD
jgi:hypothetical protein